ncbi:sugar transferase [Marimonas arenosa]|uniref:Sugar transferase n=1 Tax=Marimonas arenosa TaxID=1795305 RepID=A0AAE3WBX8_9RHOB|nr:sugar transferase [Marimonas arenosa]MDQ2089663.1 sugar transferase [Marimonas arenosa]
MTVQFRDSVGTETVDISEREIGRQGDRFGIYRAFGKRAFDIFFVLITAPAGLMLVALTALLTALDGHSPFYWQKRVGRGGRVFRMLKIRTMVPDAEARLLSFLDENSEARREWDLKQKLHDDPRVTQLGHILRRTSLDELPQLWNVLKGDMSIVGPRPMMEDQKQLYPGQDYYALRPGITGLWQISDRSYGSFAARASFDTVYNRILSFGTDLRILAATVGVVLRCTGR